MLRSLALALLVLPLAAPPAVADAPPSLRFSQQVFGLDGNPELVANTSAPPREPIRWLVCGPDGTCGDAAPGSFLTPGDVPAGTTFVARATIENTEVSATSTPWGGRVAATGPPGFSNPLVAGATLAPVAAPWAGGWGTESDELRVEACTAPDGLRCTTLSAPFDEAAGQHLPTVLDTGAIGSWLRVIDRRHASGEVVAGVAYQSVQDAPLLPRGQTIVAAPPAGPGAPPKVTLYGHARQTPRGLTVGTIRCAGRCVARFRGTSAGGLYAGVAYAYRAARLTFALPKGTGPLDLRVHVDVAGQGAPRVARVLRPYPRR